jgi:hypothetical protein
MRRALFSGRVTCPLAPIGPAVARVERGQGRLGTSAFAGKRAREREGWGVRGWGRGRRARRQAGRGGGRMGYGRAVLRPGDRVIWRAEEGKRHAGGRAVAGGLVLRSGEVLDRKITVCFA